MLLKRIINLIVMHDVVNLGLKKQCHGVINYIMKVYLTE
jgi:hypothetical protein